MNTRSGAVMAKGAAGLVLLAVVLAASSPVEGSLFGRSYDPKTISPCKKGKSLGDDFKVTVDECNLNNLPCKLVKGKDYEIRLSGKSPVDISAEGPSKVVVHGLLRGMSVPFALPHPTNKCEEGGGLTCGIKKGQEFGFHVKLPIKSMYPSVKVGVKMEGTNEKGESIFCLVIPVEIVTKAKNLRPNERISV
eukprot:Nk52_evm51s212 gene=Nk52_evmTU51s212